MNKRKMGKGMSTVIDMTGKVVGRWTVLERATSPNGKTCAFWLCKCKCGFTRVMDGSTLRYGNTRSCGCLNSEMTSERNRTHGMRRVPEYKSWAHMRGRCLNPKNKSFHHYGGRGITICERWSSFENFYADMGRKPSRKHSLDRIDNDGNYEPGNCRWATQKVQTNNKRNNIRLTFDGETKSISEWSERTGVKYATLLQRFHSGWPPHEILHGRKRRRRK